MKRDYAAWFALWLGITLVTGAIAICVIHAPCLADLALAYLCGQTMPFPDHHGTFDDGGDR